MFAIAIDGPAGAGKSTVARGVAKKLGFIYVDTGALYRAVGYYAIKNSVDTDDANTVEEMLGSISVDIRFVDAEQHVFLNDEDVNAYIRTPEVSMMASKVSAIPCVRAFLLSLQRNLAATNNVIMDGRDIGTVVLPNADVKIFMTASPECRAKRRCIDLEKAGHKPDFAQVLAEIETRDYNDSHRAIAPLKPAEDSVIFDSTGNQLEQSVDAVIKIIREKLPV